jgi:hypothetical protein
MGTIEHGDQLGRARGRNRQGGHLLGDLIFQNGDLLVDIHFALRRQHRQPDARIRLGGILRARFDALPPFTIESFGHDRDIDCLFGAPLSA